MQQEEQPKTQNKKMKVDKYDRQIRLWGPRGQRALGQSRVALVKCTGAGIQTLKNLILPGVGTVDIWDQGIIKVEDLSSSFFYQHESVGQPKAQVASKNLLEMNEDSKGSFFLKSVEEFLADEKAIKSYSLVVFGGDLTQQQTKNASSILWKLDVPCIFITVAGFFFYVRLQKKHHFVESSNTMAKKYYLRISDPFPQLLQHAQEHCIYTKLQKLSTLNVDQHRDQFISFSQIPSVLIMISILNKLPKQQRKRNLIKQQLNRILGLAHPDYRQNIRQALSGIIDPLQTPDIFMIDIGLLSNQSVLQCTKDSHIMLKFLWATNQFFEETGKLPQPTLLPDMGTTTEKYIGLKHIYNLKHKNDTITIIEKIKAKFGDDNIDQGLISDYINHLSNLEVIQMRPYYEELVKPDEYSLSNCYNHQKELLLAIRTYQKLYSQNAENFEAYQKLKQSADQLQKSYGIQSYDQKYIQEVHRSRGKSLVTIYSIAGALAGQEAIKLITGCFSPMNSGYFFDGANGRGYQVKF